MIRQAILAYERMLEEKELLRVHRAAMIEMSEIEVSNAPTHPFDEIKKLLKS